MNPKVNINEIEFYLFKEQELIKSAILGNSYGIENNVLNSKYSSFVAQIEPNIKYTLITSLKSKSPIDINWLIFTKDGYIQYVGLENMLWGVFGGVILALIIYNFSLFVSLKESLYIVYVLLGFFIYMFQLSTNGLIYQYQIFGNLAIFNTISWLFAEFVLLLLFIFAMLFFNTKIEMPNINKLLKILIAFHIGLIALFFITTIYPEIIYLIRYITKPLAFLSLTFIIFIAIQATYKKLDGAIFFLVGQTVLLFSLIYQQYGGVTHFHTTLMTIFSVPFGSLIEILFLSFALSKRLAKLKYEKEKNEKLLIHQSGFSSIGKTLGNLFHQLKAPFSAISTIATLLEVYVNRDKQPTKDELLNIANNLRNSIAFVDETAEQLTNLYKTSNMPKSFKIIEAINDVLMILNFKSMNTKSKIKVICEKDFEITSIKNIFVNVMLIVIDNSLDIFSQRNIKYGVILIKIEKIDEKSFRIIIKDNGKGITIKPIDLIFETLVSTKENGGGIGLAMAKILLEEKLNGNIKASNDKKGAMFEIIISKL